MITIIVGIVCFFVGADVECYLWKREGEKYRALVKELSDALSQSVINHCYRCKFFRLKHTECKDKKNEVKCWSKSFKLLIEKSREVCK